MLEKSKEFYFMNPRSQMKLSHYAAMSPNGNNLKFLIENNVSFFDLDNQKNSPFMFSCLFGRLEQVKVFLANDKLFNYKHKNRQGMMGVHLAV